MQVALALLALDCYPHGYLRLGDALQQMEVVEVAYDRHALSLIAAALLAIGLIVGSFTIAKSVEPASGTMIGDANCDGQANAIDAALVLQFDARLILDLGCREVADVDADGTVGSIDAALILQLDAGLIDFLPAAAREAIAAAIQATAETLSIPEDQVIVRSVSAETWPNGCLGLPEPGEACTEALVDGYRIRLKGWLVPLPAPTPPSPTAVPAEFLSWRTNLDGSQIRLEGIAIP